MRIL
ncbi:hypothetical protein YPPY54_0295, partial [Yersinia pestis PY-54]|jgi:hypothetical protein